MTLNKKKKKFFPQREFLSFTSQVLPNTQTILNSSQFFLQKWHNSETKNPGMDQTTKRNLEPIFTPELTCKNYKQILANENQHYNMLYSS